jgi:hypothetical protein
MKREELMGKITSAIGAAKEIPQVMQILLATTILTHIDAYTSELSSEIQKLSAGLAEFSAMSQALKEAEEQVKKLRAREITGEMVYTIWSKYGRLTEARIIATVLNRMMKEADNELGRA